ncbi:MAG: PQQ-binding-like beta-propeller repeat protein [Thermoplasmata archaeon]
MSDGASIDLPLPNAAGPHFARLRLLLVVIVAVVVVFSALSLGLLSTHVLPAAGLQTFASTSSIPLGVGVNYPTYLDNNGRTDNGGWQGPINTSDAHELHALWSYATGGAVWAQPIVVNGVVYVGSSDGYEYAMYATNGTFLWKTYLGMDMATPICGGAPGVTSTATFVGGILYVSGGYSDFYALSAATGSILWSLPIGGTNANADGFYLWASPLVYNHSAYIGISSQCDNPLVPAGLERISLNTHAEIAYFNSSVPYPNGSSLWGSPSLNERTNIIYVTTGNPYASLTSTYGESIVALNASTLRVIASWQVPAAQVIGDGDFGVTPTLFNLSNGLGVVTAENKNGYLYEWYQSNLTLVWERDLATKGGDHYSTSYANGRLFAVAHGVTIGSTFYNSSITALNPTTGAILWQVGTTASPGAGYAVPLITNNVLVLPIGTTLYVLNAVTGHFLYQDALSSASVPPASVSRGEIFIGDGNDIVAFDVALGLRASQNNSSGTAPLSDSFTATPTGGVPAYSYYWAFGDGTVSTAQTPTHLFSTPGTYQVTITVTDLAGSVVTHQFTVTVSAPARWSLPSRRPPT